MSFVNIYGPGAPRVEGHGEYGLFTLFFSAQSLTIRLGWFGAVGTILGFLCGAALIILPSAVSYLLFHHHVVVF